MARIDWYFDFVSPFSYLQSELLFRRALAAEVRYRPVLFAGLLDHWNNIGPAELEPKRIWTLEHCTWLAHRHDIALKLPVHHPFNSLPLLRLCVALGSSASVVRLLFRYVWREGRLPTETDNWQELLQQLGASSEMLEQPAVKQELRRNGEEAVAAGVFGVPTAVVDNRCFWGADATEMLLAYLSNDPFFESEPMQRARTLPQGIQRNRRTT